MNLFSHNHGHGLKRIRSELAMDVKRSLVRAYVTQESSNSIGTNDKNKEVYKERREQWMKQRAIQSGTRRMKYM